MVKPRLPRELERRIPSEVLHKIYEYVPHSPKLVPASPQLQRELVRLQGGNKKTTMYLRDLDDFVLDKQ